MGQKNDQKNDALKKKDKQLAENLKISYDMAKIQLNDEILRNERLDAKFNFLLVFLAGLLAALNMIIPYEENLTQTSRIISNVILIEFIASVIISGLLILLGMFPKANNAIDSKNFVNPEFNTSDETRVLGGYIKGLADSIDSYHKTNEKKARLMKAAFIFGIIAFAFFLTLLIIKII